MTFNLKQQMASVHEGKLKCKMCDKSFSSDTYMKKNMTSVHEERKAFKCTFCKKSFKCTFCEKSSSLVENP